jgi:hypothetical protein
MAFLLDVERYDIHLLDDFDILEMRVSSVLYIFVMVVRDKPRIKRPRAVPVTL